MVSLSRFDCGRFSNLVDKNSIQMDILCLGHARYAMFEQFRNGYYYHMP